MGVVCISSLGTRPSFYIQKLNKIAFKCYWIPQRYRNYMHEVVLLIATSKLKKHNISTLNLILTSVSGVAEHCSCFPVSSCTIHVEYNFLKNYQVTSTFSYTHNYMSTIIRRWWSRSWKIAIEFKTPLRSLYSCWQTTHGRSLNKIESA